MHVIQHCILIVCRTRANHQKKLILLPLEDSLNLLIPLLLQQLYLVRQRKLFLDLLRSRKLPDEIHLHFHVYTSDLKPERTKNQNSHIAFTLFH